MNPGKKGALCRRPSARQVGKKAPEALIWGIHPVEELLKARPELLLEILFRRQEKHAGLEAIAAAARTAKIPLRQAREGECDWNDSWQGVCARVRPLPVISGGELLDMVVARGRETEPVFLLALDSVQDPQNLGAVLRSALAAGVDAVIVPEDRSAPLSGTVAKASAGALWHLPIARVVNLSRMLAQLKQAGVWTVASTRTPAATAVFSLDLTLPLCIVVGNEEKGVRPGVLSSCDFSAKIPMRGSIDSLNCSAAAAVLLFEVLRQRSQLR